MKYLSPFLLMALALRDVPPLYRAGKRRELAIWLGLAAFTGALLWLCFWSGSDWTLADFVNQFF